MFSEVDVFTREKPEPSDANRHQQDDRERRKDALGSTNVELGKAESATLQVRDDVRSDEEPRNHEKHVHSDVAAGR
jgi:hypothetical protein